MKNMEIKEPQDFYAVSEEIISSSTEKEIVDNLNRVRIYDDKDKKQQKIYSNKIDWNRIPANLFTMSIFFTLGLLFGGFYLPLAIAVALIPASALDWRKIKANIFYKIKD